MARRPHGISGGPALTGRNIDRFRSDACLRFAAEQRRTIARGETAGASNVDVCGGLLVLRSRITFAKLRKASDSTAMSHFVCSDCPAAFGVARARRTGRILASGRAIFLPTPAYSDDAAAVRLAAIADLKVQFSD